MVKYWIRSIFPRKKKKKKKKTTTNFYSWCLISLVFIIMFYLKLGYNFLSDFPDSSIGKESVCNAGDWGSIPGSRRSTGEGIGFVLISYLSEPEQFHDLTLINVSALSEKESYPSM